jgi:hypothetical protein
MVADWTFNGNKILSHDDLHPDCTDIVYVITYCNQRMYIGKKAVRAIRRKPPLKGYKRNRRIMTNLPFVNYQGSHEHAKVLVAVKKEIIYQCSKRKASTYLEAELLFRSEAIFLDKFINENISGTFFKNSLQGLIRDANEQNSYFGKTL